MAPTRTLTAPIPATRDPFINTPLIRVPSKVKGGPERFWTSTWNANEGTIAVLTDEFGAHEVHRFKPPHFGFYSAVAEDADTLWLCGDLSRVVRYRPSTRKLDVYETGAPSGLVFNGMAFDRASGKLWAMSNAGTPHAFAFDTRKLKSTFAGPTNIPGLYIRHSFPVGDGTWAIVNHLPAQSLTYWDPKTDKLSSHTIVDSIDVTEMNATTYFLLRDKIAGVDGECVYVPNMGWFDPRKRKYIKGGPRPKSERTWRARWKNFVVGTGCVDPGQAIISLWDLKTGAVRDVCKLPDTSMQEVNFTQSGAIVAVSLYGDFMRLDLMSGELIVNKKIDASARGAIDCLARVAPDRVLGTTFITQRFWEANLRTKKGEDLGRVAPGVGEIMKLCKVDGKVYMAAYTGAELVEYDPSRPARYPENPRVVAKPPHGMRPVAMIAAGTRVFYSSNTHYGHLGCVLARYDTKTGIAQSTHDPIPNLAIRTLALDASAKLLIVGTSIHADCGSSPPKSKSAHVATIDPETLKVVTSRAMPGDIDQVFAVCPMGGGKWACVTNPRGGKRGAIFEVSIRNLEIPAESKWRELETQGVMWPTRTQGVVVMRTGEGLHLWDLRKLKAIRKLAGKESAGWHCHIEGDDILGNDREKVYVLDGVLRGV